MTSKDIPLGKLIDELKKFPVPEMLISKLEDFNKIYRKISVHHIFFQNQENISEMDQKAKEYNQSHDLKLLIQILGLFAGTIKKETEDIYSKYGY